MGAAQVNSVSQAMGTVEPFAGAGYVFFHRAPAAGEVPADADAALRVRYRALRRHVEEFLRHFRRALVSRACKTHGGFYLGSSGGPAAILAHDNIKKVTLVESPELGMEAIGETTVEDFPAFIVVDGKGNDFFADLMRLGAVVTSRIYSYRRFSTGLTRAARVAG